MTDDDAPGSTELAPPPTTGARWRLVGDLIGFQIKMMLNGLCEVVLAPAALIAALIGLVFSPRDPARHFRTVLGLGRTAETWIGIYDVLEPRADARRGGLDEQVARIEQALVDLEARGGLTARARATIDRILDRATRARR